MRKTRPAMVISSDGIGRLPAPITEWKTYFENSLWHVNIKPLKTNGLNKNSAVDILQVRDIDIQRFVKRFGTVSETTMQKIVCAIALVIEYQ
ncbi:MAG: type II toxin-antitoxin system PemK/MazF family toxin [Chloroflexi bacterium]|nr:type II toxin-antitoxin system PemK/MazF family toxin [Chloroflexota bacterium]